MSTNSDASNPKDSGHVVSTKSSRTRRPERQLYVIPRARHSVADKSVSETKISSHPNGNNIGIPVSQENNSNTAESSKDPTPRVTYFDPVQNELLPVGPKSESGVIEVIPKSIEEKTLKQKEVEGLLHHIRKQYVDRLNYVMEFHPFKKAYKTYNWDFEAPESRGVHALLKSYTHRQACEFLAFVDKSPVATSCELPDGPACRIPMVDTVNGHYALYRVVHAYLDRNGKVAKYLAVTCHLNVLKVHENVYRYLLIDKNSMLIGLSVSCIGLLFLGDVIAVKSIKQLPIKPAFLEKYTQHLPPDFNAQNIYSSAVHSFHLIERKIEENVNFVIMKDGKAARLDNNSILNVCHINSLQENAIYSGNIFYPVNEGFGLCHGVTDFDEARECFYQFLSVPFEHPIVLKADIVQELQDPDFLFQQHVHIACNALQVAQFGCFDRKILKLDAAQQSRGIKNLNQNPFEHKESAEILFKDSREMPNNWKKGTCIVIYGLYGEVRAKIISIKKNRRNMEIEIFQEDTDEFKKFHWMETVTQLEVPIPIALNPGFFTSLGESSNAKKVIRAFNGGPPILQNQPDRKVEPIRFPSNPPLELNEQQSAYVNQILSGSAITIGNAPFGCGKSLPLVTAAILSADRNPEQLHILVTQSDGAAEKLVSLLMKATGNNGLKHLHPCRYVSQKLGLPDECKTSLDFPNLLNAVTGKTRNPKVVGKGLAKWYKLDIIVSTVDSLWELAPHLENVGTIQFYEANHISEANIISFISMFPMATYGLMGDIKQLGPKEYCCLTEFLARFAVGNLMEKVVKENLFPVISLSQNYEHHPFITEMIGDMFYDGCVIPQPTRGEKDEYIKKRSDIWKNFQCPIALINNTSSASCKDDYYTNWRECTIKLCLLEKLKKTIPREDIGVIDLQSMCKDSVYSFRGMKKEIIVLNVSDSSEPKTVGNPKLVSSAISRAKQGIVIIGNVEKLSEVGFWKLLIEKVKEFNSVMEQEYITS